MILLGRHNRHEAVTFSAVFVSFTYVDLECNTRCFLYQNARKERAPMTQCRVEVEQVWIQQNDLEFSSELHIRKRPNVTIFFPPKFEKSVSLEGLFIYSVSPVQNINAQILSCYGLSGFPLKFLAAEFSGVADQFVLWVQHWCQRWAWGWTLAEVTA